MSLHLFRRTENPPRTGHRRSPRVAGVADVAVSFRQPPLHVCIDSAASDAGKRRLERCLSVFLEKKEVSAWTGVWSLMADQPPQPPQPRAKPTAPAMTVWQVNGDRTASTATRMPGDGSFLRGVARTGNAHRFTSLVVILKTRLTA